MKRPAAFPIPGQQLTGMTVDAGLSALDEPSDAMSVTKQGRFWAVYHGETLVCLAVYRRGAREVVRRFRAGAEGSAS